MCFLRRKLHFLQWHLLLDRHVQNFTLIQIKQGELYSKILKHYFSSYQAITMFLPAMWTASMTCLSHHESLEMKVCTCHQTSAKPSHKDNLLLKLRQLELAQTYTLKHVLLLSCGAIHSGIYRWSDVDFKLGLMCPHIVSKCVLNLN